MSNPAANLTSAAPQGRLRGRALPLWFKVLFALHFPLVVIGVNYFAPLSNFQTRRTVGTQIEAIISGLAPTPRASERVLRVGYLETVPAAPKVAAWGSSRGLSVNAEAALTPNFVNLSTSYGVLFDLAAIYSVLDRTGKFPETMILALDAWMLSKDVKARFWTEYGHDVPRGLQLIGMDQTFASELEGPAAQLKAITTQIQYLLSPVVFRQNLLDAVHRVKASRDLSILRTVVSSRPINREKDGWDRDLSYWYPCIPINDVRDRAVRWGTDRATYGEKLLDGDLNEFDPDRIELLKKLITAIRAKGVKVLIFLSPIHPLSFSDMGSTPTRRATVAADGVFRNIAQGLNVPIFGSSDPAKVGLAEPDFCTDAIHVRPDVLKKVFDFTGLTETLAR